MPKNLFKIRSRCIRFDDTTMRSQRYESDTLAYAAFREIWDDFNNRLHLFFEASDSAVVDEQLKLSLSITTPNLLCTIRPSLVNTGR